jgi:hypothetical protein
VSWLYVPRCPPSLLQGSVAALADRAGPADLAGSAGLPGMGGLAGLAVLPGPAGLAPYQPATLDGLASLENPISLLCFLPANHCPGRPPLPWPTLLPYPRSLPCTAIGVPAPRVLPAVGVLTAAAVLPAVRLWPAAGLLPAVRVLPAVRAHRAIATLQPCSCQNPAHLPIFAARPRALASLRPAAFRSAVLLARARRVDAGPAITGSPLVGPETLVLNKWSVPNKWLSARMGLVVGAAQPLD